MILMASGSEVGQVVEAAEILKKEGIDARVVSMPSMELFNAQSAEYKESVLPKSVTKRVAMEAARTFGWYQYVGLEGKVIGLDRFGASAPGSKVYEELGITTQAVVDAVKAL